MLGILLCVLCCWGCGRPVETKPARDPQEAYCDVEILRRYARGETQQEIADAFGIELATVYRVLKKQQF